MGDFENNFVMIKSEKINKIMQNTVSCSLRCNGIILSCVFAFSGTCSFSAGACQMLDARKGYANCSLGFIRQ